MVNGDFQKALLRGAIALIIAFLGWQLKEMNDELKAHDRRLIEQAKVLIEVQAKLSAMEKR